MSIYQSCRAALLLATCIVTAMAGCDRESSTPLSRPHAGSATTSRSSDSGVAAANAIVKANVWSDTKLTGESVTPTQIKEAQSSKDASTKDALVTQPQEILLAGRIDAGDSPAFSPKESAFILSQLPDEGHGDDPEHADNCPFCKRRLKNAPKAIVQIRNEEGELLPISVDSLLGLKKGDAVLVAGEARYDDTLKTIFVQAKKISMR